MYTRYNMDGNVKFDFYEFNHFSYRMNCCTDFLHRFQKKNYMYIYTHMYVYMCVSVCSREIMRDTHAILLIFL